MMNHKNNEESVMSTSGDKEVFDMMNSRIDRMEAKLDKLVDAVTELVKVDIQLSSLTDRLNRHSDSLSSLDARIDVIEKKVPVYDIVVNWGGRIAMVVSTTIILGILGSYFVFGNVG